MNKKRATRNSTPKPKGKAGKERLDKLVHTLGLSESREQAAKMIMAGLVVVDDHRVDKAGKLVSTTSHVRLKSRLPFVSRGGYKLAHGVSVFGLEPRGKRCLDIGSSTGGFTDVLLQGGASQVYCVDVGESLLHHSIESHPNVCSIPKTNFRTIDFATIGETLDIIVGDLSFISLRLIFPSIVQFLHAETSSRPSTTVVMLIKPQFEADRGTPMRHGILKDLSVHEKIILQVLRYAEESQLCLTGLTPSPVLGGKGNREYLCCLKACSGGIKIGENEDYIRTIIHGVVYEDLCYNL